MIYHLISLLHFLSLSNWDLVQVLVVTWSVRSSLDPVKTSLIPYPTVKLEYSLISTMKLVSQVRNYCFWTKEAIHNDVGKRFTFHSGGIKIYTPLADISLSRQMPKIDVQRLILDCPGWKTYLPAGVRMLSLSQVYHIGDFGLRRWCKR